MDPSTPLFKRDDFQPDRAGKGWRWCLLACFCLPLLSGCFQTPAPEGSATLREARRIEAAASPERAQVAPAPVYNDLARALRLYTLVDDTPGAIRIRLSLAYLHEQHAQTDAAQREARQALLLARELGDPAYLYRALLMLGRLQQEPALFSEALNYARTGLQRAVLLTYLGRAEEAATQVRGLTEPGDEEVGDLAFVLFAHAQQILDATTAERALALYKRVDDYAGIARSLRLLAQIATQSGDIPAAAIYAARARRVESALSQATSTRAPPPGKPPK